MRGKARGGGEKTIHEGVGCKVEGGILEYCWLSKQGQGFLERDRGKVSDSADGKMRGKERVGQNKKHNANGL